MGEKRKLIAPGHLSERLKRLSAPKGANNLHHEHQRRIHGKIASSVAHAGSSGVEADDPRDHEQSDSEAVGTEAAQVSPYVNPGFSFQAAYFLLFMEKARRLL